MLWTILVACTSGSDVETDALDTDVEPTLVELVALDAALCLRWSDGVVECRSPAIDDFVHPTDDAFVDVDGPGGFACGLTAESNVRCFGDPNELEAHPALPAAGDHVPDGADLTTVSVYTSRPEGGIRGVTGAGAVAYWYDGDDTLMDNAVYVAVDDEVAVEAGGRIGGVEGTYTTIAAAGAWFCGLLQGGAVSCPVNGDPLAGEEPAGSFVAVARHHGAACALGSGGLAVCWGGAPEAPTSSGFTTIAVGSDYACAGLASGEVECWGNPPVAP